MKTDDGQPKRGKTVKGREGREERRSKLGGNGRGQQEKAL